MYKTIPAHLGGTKGDAFTINCAEKVANIPLASHGNYRLATKAQVACVR